MNNEKMLVRGLLRMGAVVTSGWFIAFIILPAIRPEYQPAPEISMLTGTIFTGLAGVLTALGIKARRPRDDSGRDPSNHDNDTESGGDRDAEP
ncbi:hypothetical protein ACWFPY_17830 [Nocardia fluminea]